MPISRFRAVVALTLLSLTACAADAPAPVHFPDEPWFDAGSVATVLVFARDDCPISNRYAPELASLHERFARDGVAFLRVYPDPAATPETMAAHGERFGYPFPAVADPDHRLVAATGVRVTPEAVVLGPDGRLLYRGRIDDRWISFGRARREATSRDLVDALDAVLAGNAPAETVTTEAVGCYVEDLA